MRILILIFIVIILNGCIIFPKSEVYAPRIEGTVIDENGVPIEGAKVTRIENKSVESSNGVSISIQILTDTAWTDISGKFVLKSKSEISWMHGGIQSDVFFCFGNFKVIHDGYSKYQSRRGEYERETNSGNMCEEVKFESEVVLIKSN